MKIQFGAIVTNGAGSMGGQTIRRWRGGHIMQNKTSFTRNLKAWLNPRLPFISSAFRAWRNLSSAEKEQWNYVATLYQFPDKFGVLRNLSGRQLQVKLYCGRWFSQERIPDPFDLDAFIPYVEYSATVITVSENKFSLELYAEAPGTVFTIAVMPLQSVTDIVPINQPPIIATQALTGSTTAEVWDQVVQRWGNIVPGSAWMVVVIPYSPSGFSGNPMVERWVAEA